MEIQKVTAIISFLILGIILKKLIIEEKLKAQVPLILNKIIIYICLPALILKVMPTIEIKGNAWFYPLSHWFALFLLATLTYATSKALKFERKTLGCLLILIPLGNTSFLGYPMVEVFFGTEALPYAVLYDQLGSFLGLAIYAPIILSIYSDDKIPTLKTFLKSIVSFPPLIALLFSLTFKELILNEFIQTMVTPLSQGIIPLAMIAVGLQFQRASKDLGLPLTLGLSYKMILSPLLTLLFFIMFGLLDRPEKVLIFQSAMPPMITAAILASEKGLHKNLSISLTGLGLLLSFIILPACFSLLRLF